MSARIRLEVRAWARVRVGLGLVSFPAPQSRLRIAGGILQAIPSLDCGAGNETRFNVHTHAELDFSYIVPLVTTCTACLE